MAEPSLSISGGKKAAAYLDKMAARLGDGRFVKVGFLAGATYPAGKKVKVKKAGKVVGRRVKRPKGSSAITALQVATVALWNNFGTRRTPARPFFTNAVKKGTSEWGKQTAALVKAEGYDTVKVLNTMGEVIQGDIRQSIIDTNTPKLSERTIAEKGFEKPLIDTATMLRAVDYEQESVAS